MWKDGFNALVCLIRFMQAPSHKYSAHSSHVTNVSFTHNDSHLISTGGKDMSIIQWKLVEKLSLPQNEISADTTSAKALTSSTEGIVQPDTHAPAPSQSLNETAEDHSRSSSPPTLLENSLEQTAAAHEEHGEEQSEGGSEELGEPADEGPAPEEQEPEPQPEPQRREDPQQAAPLP